MPHRELVFRILACGALGYAAFVLGMLLAMSVEASDWGMTLVSSVLSVGGAALAFSCGPRLVYRLAAASLGVICLGLGWLTLAFRDPTSGAGFALAASCFVLASLVLRIRHLSVVGSVLLAAALIRNYVTQGTSWTNTLPLAAAGLCVAGMSLLLRVQARPGSVSQ